VPMLHFSHVNVAMDTIDHDILIHCLLVSFANSGKLCDLLLILLSGSMSCTISPHRVITPVGPLLYSFYIADIAVCLASCGVWSQCSHACFNQL